MRFQEIEKLTFREIFFSIFFHYLINTFSLVFVFFRSIIKVIIYFVLAILVCGIYVGCSENEIDLYDQTPRINFYGSTTHVRTLVDTDYVKKEPYAANKNS